MNKRIKKLLTKYGCCAAFVLLMVYLYIVQRPYSGAEQMEKYRMLCDAFYIPGVILVMVGCLMWASTTGFFDGMAYVFGMAFRSLIPGGRWKDEKYVDYVERKRENRVKGYGFLFVSGVVTLAISGVYMYLFYQLYS